MLEDRAQSLPRRVGLSAPIPTAARFATTPKPHRALRAGLLGNNLPKICLSLLLCGLAMSPLRSEPTPKTALLVLNKRDNSLAIIDPTTLKVVARVPAGPDPHEVVASSDGKYAYISNYGGSGSNLNTLSVVDLVAQKALRPVDL